MRRAFAAAVLFATITAAPAAAGNEEVYYTITFQEARVAKVDSFTVKQGVKPLRYHLDRVYVKSWSTSGDAAPPPRGFPGGVRVASGDVNNRPGGANRLVVTTAMMGGCHAGRRYPSAVMVGGGKTYTFRDVTITGCTSEGPREKITFVYGTLR